MKKTLCIDIGGTRIKAAILKDNIDLKSLKNIKVEVIQSLGWLNYSLPQILSRHHPGSLLQKNSSLNHYDCVSLSVPVKVIDNGSEVKGHYVYNYGMPRNLRKAFEEVCGCKVNVKNDSVCWLSGALNYSSMSSRKIEFPCFIAALGTGVGIAAAEQASAVNGLDLSSLNVDFPNLSNISGQAIDMGWKIHTCLGEKYFQWVKNEHREWDYYTIQEDYTRRIAAFIKDIKEKKIFSFENIRTFFIGGGNAEYIKSTILEENIYNRIQILTASKLQFNPDLIPLLGQISLP